MPVGFQCLLTPRHFMIIVSTRTLAATLQHVVIHNNCARWTRSWNAPPPAKTAASVTREEVLWEARVIWLMPSIIRVRARRDSSDRRPIIIIRPGRKHQHRAILCYRPRDTRRRCSSPAIVTAGNFPPFLSLFRLHFATLRKWEETKNDVRCDNLSRVEPIAKPTAPGRAIAKAVAPAFIMQITIVSHWLLRKCTSQRRRAGYRFLRTPKLQLCPLACFIRHVLGAVARRVIRRSELYKVCKFSEFSLKIYFFPRILNRF